MANVSERLREAAAGNGMTALMWAAAKGYDGCVEVLLPASNVLAQDCHGMTSLMWTASNGYDICARLLLPVSDTSAKAKDGMTASDLAHKWGHKSLAQFINAYAQARCESEEIKVAVGTGAPRGGTATRM